MKLTNKQIENALREMMPFPVTIEGVEHMEEMMKNIGDPDINCLNEIQDSVFAEITKGRNTRCSGLSDKYLTADKVSCQT